MMPGMTKSIDHRKMKDALDDGKQDDLAGKGERVKKALIRHFLAAAGCRSSSSRYPAFRTMRDETDEDAHKAEREHCEARRQMSII